MAANLTGPGMLWVTSRVAPSAESILNEETFLRWYDDDHIAEIVATDGIDDAFRYIHTPRDSVTKPFLACYPMEDLEFLKGEGFKKIRVHSDILPGSGLIYDLADIDTCYMGLVGKTEAKGKKEPAQYFLVSAIEPASSTSDEEVNEFYDNQTAIVSKAPNYLRTLKFKLIYARTNAQSRALKGLPALSNEPPPEPPTWQAVHEFSAEPLSEVAGNVQGDSSEVLKKAKQSELHVYKLLKVHGGGKFFE